METINLQSQIIISQVEHNGSKLDAYIPQINIGNGWVNVMGEKCYILVQTYNPFHVCTNCNGNGCKQCGGRGTIKGEPVDNRPVAESILENEVKKVINAFEVINKYK